MVMLTVEIYTNCKAVFKENDNSCPITPGYAKHSVQIFASSLRRNFSDVWNIALRDCFIIIMLFISNIVIKIQSSMFNSMIIHVIKVRPAGFGPITGNVFWGFLSPVPFGKVFAIKPFISCLQLFYDYFL